MLRIIALFFMGLIVALGIALHEINLETLRGNILSVLRDTTNLPVEIDGHISWKFSLRPEIELNSVRVANADWAKEKNLFTANKIDVRLDLISLFRKKPVIRYIKVHDVKMNLEKNAEGKNSVVFVESLTSEKQPDTSINTISKYPFTEMPFSGLEIQNITANIYGRKYALNSFGLNNGHYKDKMEYTGWVKPYNNNLPFVVKFNEYNTERKIYPVRIAMATGGEALIADIALEGTSKLPIDIIVRGDIPNIQKSGDWFNVDIMKVPNMKVNIAVSIDRKKLSFRKSSVNIGLSELSFFGTYDWSKNTPVLNAKITSNKINIYKSFPEWFGIGREWIHPNRDLNCFKNIPLFGDILYGMDVNIDLYWKDFIIFHSLGLSELKVKLNVKDHKVRADVNTEIASGNVNVILVADISKDGVYTAKSAAHGEHIYVGEILKEIDVNNVLSGLPVNLDFYVHANGADLSGIMKTITGPVIVYSVDKGYAHSDLVEYMYGGDFLTILRQNVQDLLSGNKRDMIKINKAIVNVKLRNGLIETQNGVAVESQVINLRLAGSLNLGKEEIEMSLASVPVRGLKLSLSGNLVNALQISGNLAEPDFKISGKAIAGKVGSAVGLGLLLAPLTGGLSLAGGMVAGFFAGDLLESWLADDHPYQTAMKEGAPSKEDDPKWMNFPIEVLSHTLFETKGQ
ncbi:MAG: AsmA family protein [Alphaproteobacteria bacterium]|nr:AsmA family protein [Alphaproteobacteria bacterium]